MNKGSPRSSVPAILPTPDEHEEAYGLAQGKDGRGKCTDATWGRGSVSASWWWIAIRSSSNFDPASLGSPEWITSKSQGGKRAGKTKRHGRTGEAMRRQGPWVVHSDTERWAKKQ